MWGRALCVVLLVAGCGDDDALVDAGSDAARDVGVDAGADAGSDARIDATDAAVDAGAEDAGVDAADVGIDVSPDTAVDARDASFDVDPGPCGDLAPAFSSESLSALAPTSWGRAAYVSERVRSQDLLATEAFVVTSDDFPVPDDCTTPDCSPRVQLVVRGSVPGVTRSSTDVVVEADALFRLRFDVPFLAPVGFFATVTFENACRSDCGATERRCVEDDACYGNGRDFCLACDHESPARCACVGPDGRNLPDDQDCVYVLGDIAVAGTCTAGMCR